MSQHVKAALLATRGLGKNERAVAVAIAAHMNRAGDAWPSVATIAEYADCSERTVQRALARLITAGRIVWRQVAGIATRVYRLVTAAVRGTPTTGPAQSSTAPDPTQHRPGTTPGPPGVTDDSRGVSDPAAGGDSQAVTRSGEVGKEMLRGNARDWRRWLPKTRNAPPVPRGAALPPPPGVDRCHRPGHLGQPAGRCIPCRSEVLGVTG